MCGVKTFESRHRTRWACDAPLILFKNVVGVFALLGLDALVAVIVVAFYEGSIGTPFSILMGPSLPYRSIALVRNRSAAFLTRLAVSKQWMVFPCLSTTSTVP